MLHHGAAFLQRAAQLHGVGRVGFFHHHALEELGFQLAIYLPEALVERERFVLGGHHLAGGEQERRFIACMESTRKWLLRNAQGFKELTALGIAWCEHRIRGDRIEQDQRAACDVMPAFQCFAVGPDEAVIGEITQLLHRITKTRRDGQPTTVAVPQRAGWCVDQRTPAIDGVLGVGSCGRLAIRSVRIAGAAKGVFKAGGVRALHDLPRIGRHAAAQDDHLAFGQGAAPLILACEAGHYLRIRSGEPDAIALNGGFTALLISRLVLVDSHQRSQGPAVVAGKAMAQLFDEVFLAHG